MSHRSCRALLGALVLLSGCHWGRPSAEDGVATEVGRLEAVNSFGSNPGGLRMYRYVPASMPPNAPLVVALHGCMQQAADFASIGLDALADRHKFYVVYAEQTTQNNPALCFNWFGRYNQPSDKTNLTRGRGENQSIAEMVQKMKADYSIDGSRVFVLGFSAGGAMASVMLATWPDLFAAGGVISGTPYDCPSQQNADVWRCMSPGVDLPPKDWTARVKAAFPTHQGPWPRAAIWHGAQDGIVSPNNHRELVEQWTAVHGLDQTPEQVDALKSATRKRHQAASGATLVESVEVPSLQHAVPVDSTNGCGQAGAYTSNVGLCAVEEIARFFGLVGADVTPPTVDIASPPNGATVNGMVRIIAQAGDDIAVAAVEIHVDGAMRARLNAPPYAFDWSTAAEPAGAHRLKAVAYDAAGNRAVDDDTTVTVQHVTDTTPPVTTASPPGGSYGQPIAVVLSVNEPASTYFTLDGSTPTTASTRYAGPIALSANATLRFFSVDAAGNAEPVRTEQYVFTSRVHTFTSIGAEDGFVGALPAHGSSRDIHRVGDWGMYGVDTYRVILSFDTSALPDQGPLIGATLRFWRRSGSGSVGSIWVDVQRGHFGPSPALETQDHSAAATASNVTSVSPPPSDGAFVDVEIPASVLTAIDRSGRTQIRLGARTPIDFGADLLEIEGGEAVGRAPTLTVRVP